MCIFGRLCWSDCILVKVFVQTLTSFRCSLTQSMDVDKDLVKKSDL